MEYVWILYVTLPLCGGNENVFPQYPDVFKSQTALNYVYYPQKIVWSAARSVCQSLGGDLATIDSPIIMDYIVGRAQENYGTNIFVEEYWVGLVQLQENERFWVADCRNLTFTTNYLQDFDSNKQCTRHKHDHIGDRKECTQQEAFLCQVPSSNPCDVVNLVDSEILSIETDATSCESTCLNDPKCWAAVQYVPDNCIQLAFPGNGAESFILASKFCFNVTLNETSVNDDTTNNTIIPDAVCGNMSAQSSPNSTSPMTSLGLPVCDSITVTHNLTITEMSIETTTEISINTTTEILTETTTELLINTTTETIIETTTELYNATITEIMTQTTTEQFNATTTEVSISTITATVIATQTQNITFEQAEVVAAEIVKNLTIDVKSTSSHIRRLTSANDKRQSSKFVGYIGVIFVTAPLALMMISDVRKLYFDFRSHGNTSMYKMGKISKD